jgi:hypothetical protein
MALTYVQVLSSAYPHVLFSTIGDGSNYEDIVWEGGDPLPDQATLDGQMLAIIRDSKWNQIKEERDRRKLELGYKVGDYWYHSDTTSRIQQIALLLLGANIPGNLMWKTMSGDFVQMTQTLAGQIFQAAVMSDSVLFGVAEQKRQAMIASSDPATYDHLSGWPVGFGE